MGSVFVCVVSCRISHSVHVHANAVLVVFQYAWHLQRSYYCGPSFN